MAAAAQSRKDLKVIARAAAYPYRRERCSFLFANGRVVPMRDFDPVTGALTVMGAGPRHGESPQGAGVPISSGFSQEHRTGVLAIGANGSPQQLARKFAGFADDATFPVVQAVLYDFAVVYSAHFARYGAMPATLHPCPGARARVHVTWLNDAQLAHMHASEALGENYRFTELEGIRLVYPRGGTAAHMGAYISMKGSFCPAGRPIRLAAVPHASCPLNAMTQIEVLRLARDRLSEHRGLNDFILGNVYDPELRRQRISRLAGDARLFHQGTSKSSKRPLVFQFA